MSIKVNILNSHRQYTDGLSVVEVNGNTVGDCLDNIVKQFPDIEKGIFEKKGKLLNFIYIYVNWESAFPDELARPVLDGDEIHLVPMLAGG